MFEAQANPAHSADQYTQNYVLCRSNTLRLIFPQEEVEGIGYVYGGLGRRADSQFFMPKAINENQSDTYALLTEEMAFAKTHSPEKFTWTLLAGMDVKWCWDEVSVLLDRPIHPEPLAPCLRPSWSPIEQVVRLDEHVAFYCETASLQMHVLAHGSLNDQDQASLMGMF